MNAHQRRIRRRAKAQHERRMRFVATEVARYYLDKFAGARFDRPYAEQFAEIGAA